MKTCFNCGKVLDDSASFCTGCGTSLANVPPTPQPPVYQTPAQPVYRVPATPVIPDAPVPPNTNLVKKTPTWLCVLNFINHVITIIALFFAGIGLCDQSIRVSIHNSYSSYSYFDYSPRISASAYSNPNEEMFVVALTFACLALIMSIITLVLTATKRLGAEKVFARITNIFFITMFAIFTMAGMGM